MKKIDFIIVGAGAAGPVIAARLSEDPNVRVVLIEAGRENTNDLGRMQGAFFYTWGTDMDWSYKTVPQSNLGMRPIDEPRGRVVGGSTALNVGAWIRGCASDYDAWEKAGATGWNWGKALDLFLAIENSDRGPTAWRGHGGPLTMVDLPTPTAFSDTLLSAFVEAGLGSRGDVNGETPYVADRYQTLFPNGVRRTPADAYLNEAVRQRPNLEIVTSAHVTRAIMEGRTAVGVEFLSDGETHVLRASREVILCAGAFGTPQLLMLSGIGPAEHLQSVDITPVIDLPGVGSNLQEHLIVSLRAVSPQGMGGPPAAWPGPEDLETWRRDRSGPAAYWVQNGVGFIKTTPDLPGPDVELMFQYTPDASEEFFPDIADLAQRGGYTITMILLQPRSRGSVRLASNNPTEHPLIDPAFLSHPDDEATLLAALKIVHGLTETEVMRPHTEAVHPARGMDETALREWIKQTAGIAFHPIGTARMGAANDPGAVTDPHLRVRGVSGLRVADASVFPTTIRGHTMAPAVMVGERAAELIKSEQGLR